MVKCFNPLLSIYKKPPELWVKMNSSCSTFILFLCVKSDKSPQVMSLESASVGSEDYKFGNEKNLGVWSQKEVSLPDLCGSSSLLDAGGSGYISRY